MACCQPKDAVVSTCHQVMTNNQVCHSILDFWFKQNSYAQWFTKDESFDKQVQDKFMGLWEQGRTGQVDYDSNSQYDMLAIIVLLDQFPRNMFRGHPNSFSTDGMALQLCKDSIDKGLYKKFCGKPEMRLMMLMPLMHSEDLEDQQLLVDIMDQQGMDTEYALKHLVIIDRFGRFPHRNQVLGRESTQEELKFMETHQGF